MADIGTKEVSVLYGVTQRNVCAWCRKVDDPRITQDKKGSPWHIL